MFDWFRSKPKPKPILKASNYTSLKGNYPHNTKREDWENLLDELFMHVIAPWKHGLAVISNTQNGILFPKLTFMIKDAIPSEIKQAIKQLERHEFDHIFELANQKDPDLADCYITKNLGLPNNSMVYLIQQANRKAGIVERGMLVMGGPCMKTELDEHAQQAGSIVGRPTKYASKTPPSPAKGTPPPPKIVFSQLARKKPDQVKERLNYLDSLEHLTSEERREKEMLEDKIVSIMKNSM